MNPLPCAPQSLPEMATAPKQTDLLCGVSLACRFFSRIFHGAPDTELLRALREQDLPGSWPLRCETPEAREGRRLLQAALGDESCAAIQEDFSVLFIGPEHPLRQWESTWTTKERLLFGEPAQAVRACYARHGLAAPGPDPDDHIALELAFLGDLLGRAAQAEENNDASAAAALIGDAAAFHTDHLKRWANSFLQEMEQRAVTGFYRGAALLCRAALENLEAFLAPHPAGHGPDRV